MVPIYAKRMTNSCEGDIYVETCYLVPVARHTYPVAAVSV